MSAVQPSSDADVFVAEMIKEKLTPASGGIHRKSSTSFETPCGLVFEFFVSKDSFDDGETILEPRLCVKFVDVELAGHYGNVGAIDKVHKARRAQHCARKHGWLSYDVDGDYVGSAPAFQTCITNASAQSDITARVIAMFDEARALTVCACGEWFAFGGAQSCFNCRAAFFSRLSTAGTCPVCHEPAVQRTVDCCNQPMHASCAGKTKRAKKDAPCPLCRKGSWFVV